MQSAIRGACVSVLLMGTATAGFAQDTPAGLAAATATLLESRCSSCHGAGSENSRAFRAWSQATDLAATAALPDLVVPGDPDESTLYFLVADGEMPPADSGVDALTKQEVSLISAWIEAGAPPPSPADAMGPTGDMAAAAEQGSEPRHRTPKKRPPALLRWLGRFHPLIVHYPVALLSVALLVELMARAWRKRELSTAATVCLVIGAVSAVPTAVLGWLLAGTTTHTGDTLDYHRWLGISTAVIACLSLHPFLTRPRWRLPVLLVLAILVGSTGHLGGSLSYGSDWLDWPTK